MSLRPRTNAPAYIDIKLHCQSRSPLQGTLEVQGWSSAEMVCVQQIGDLALFSGTSNQRVLLPTALRGRAVEEVRLRFLASGAVYDLGRFMTTGEMSAKRQYVIALCRPQVGFGEPQNLTWRALRPESVLPDDRSRGIEVATTPVWFAPEDMPAAIGLCAFDLVLLEGPALASLSEKQLADLTTWVEAGGSLCLVGARDLKPEHRAFLQRLALPDDDAAAKAQPSFLRRAGLGRVALIDTAPSSEDQLMSEPWTTATYHLAHSHVSNRTAGIIAAARRGYSNSNWYYDYGTLNDMEQQMLQALPRTARLIPLPVLGVILIGFILVVGPGEWIFLGRLRRRVWTWVTFPAVAIGCAFLTVRVAEHYLGVQDQHAFMVITDYSPQGKALRENRFELWFAGRNRDAVTDVRQALTVPSHQRNTSRGTEGLKPPVYEGRVPAHYTMRQPLFQWTPFIQRTLTFAPPVASSRLSWEALHELPPRYSANKTQIHDVQSADFVTEKIGAKNWNVYVFQPRLPRSERPSLAERLCMHPNDGWAFTRSPSGDATMSDVFLDHEPDDMIVVAERQVGQEIQIQRCVYHFDSHE
ncbi:MAG TPA: hypothetical protein VK961_08660 [Chthoniobacter sp.]|nr:hypothetical protein [Chthoniobacter sp.]